MSSHDLAPTSKVLLSLDGHPATFIREENEYGNEKSAYSPIYVFELKLSPDQYEDAIELKTGGKRHKRKTRKHKRRQKSKKHYTARK